MAQAGYTPISLYYSTTSTQEPTAGNLVSGELAINIADGKLFYKNSAGNVRLLSIGYGSSSVTPTNGGVQYGTGTALALTAAGSSGQILRSNGAAAPTWADLSTLGVNTISFGTTGLTPNSATAGAVTVAGTLVTANGGTGLGGATPFTANGVLYASSASALTSGSALTFDGTNFSTTGTATATKLVPTGNVTAGNGMYLPATNTLAWSNNGAETMRLDSSGNLGLGVTPSAWTSLAGGAFQNGGNGALWSQGTDELYVSQNVFFNGASRYVQTRAATAYQQSNGQHRFFTAPSGTAGNAITFTQSLTLTANRNLLVDTTTENSGNGGLKVNGQFALASSQAFTANGSVNNTAYYVVCYSLSGTCTLTLPTPADNTGRLLNIVVQSNQQVVSASSNVTAIANGSLTTSILPATAGKWAQLWCDGTYWNIIATNV